MALTRKFLSTLGIDADKIDEIITAHTESLEALKEQRDDFKAKAEQADRLEQENNGLKEKVADYEEVAKERDELKSNADKLQGAADKKYDALKAEFDKYKEEQTAKAETERKAGAYKALLLDAGVSAKRLDTILKVTDLSGVELGEDGKIKDADTLQDSIKTEWADFIPVSTKQGAETAKPISHAGNATHITWEDVDKISDPKERQALMAKHKKDLDI